MAFGASESGHADRVVIVVEPSGTVPADVLSTPCVDVDPTDPAVVQLAADLLATTKRPSEPLIRTALNGHLCRCGTHLRVITAIKRAAATMAKDGV